MVDIAAYGQPCSLRDIEVKQQKTSAYAHGKIVYNVTITNNCICTQSQIKFKCNGFQTNLSVDPAIFSDDCVLIKGGPLHYSESVNFSYAWEPLFTFQPISSQIACS